MKRFLTALIILAFLMLHGMAFAAGTVTQKVDKYPNANLQVLTFSWTADAAAATIPSTATSDANTQAIIGWYVWAIETDPGSTAPTPNYDIVINDANGFDIAGGQLANRSATATERVIPKLDATASLYGASLINSALTLVITNNLVNSATGTVKLIMTK
jgi:hypothetical protein